MRDKVAPPEPPGIRPFVWNPRGNWRRLVVVIGVIIAYVAFYFPVRTSIGPIVNAFGLIPAGLVAWLFGLRVGLLACSVIVPFNMLLSYFTGMWTTSNLAVTQDLLGNALIVVIVAVIGRMKDLQERVKLEFIEVQRAEAALQVSEQYARSIVDSSLDMIITVDGDRRIVEFNKAAERTFGYAREQVLGKQISILYANCDEEESVYRTAFEEAGAVQEVSNRRKNGEIFTSSLTAAAMRDEKGKLLGLVGVSRDITQRKQAEENLQREVGRLNALHEIDRALSTLDLQACLRIIVDRTRALFGTTAVALLLQEGEVLRLVSQAGLESAGTDILIPLSRGLTGWCLEHRQSVLVADIREDARYISVDSRTRAEMAAPLLVQDDCIGVLNVESEQVGAFAPADLTLLESFAARAAAAIKNARLLTAEREQRQFAETLRDFGLALTSELDPDAVLDQLLDLVVRVVPYDSAAVILLENGIIRNRRLRGYDQYGSSELLQKLELPVEQVPNLNEIARTREPYCVADTRSYPGWLRIEGLGHIRSWVGAPIKIRGNLLGFLSLDKAEPGFYTAEMAERLGAFATQAAIAFENARLYAEQQRLAMTDSLTGLFNRRYCLELAEREFQRARRHKTPFCILMVDIDHFKQVNDRIGHAAGDSALHKVARELAASVRAIDIVARYGGDEFLVVLPNCGERDAHRIAIRMNERVSIQTVHTEQGEIQLSVSVGIASAALVGDETIDQLIARADAEMYKVKHPPAKDAGAAY